MMLLSNCQQTNKQKTAVITLTLTVISLLEIGDFLLLFEQMGTRKNIFNVLSLYGESAFRI